MVLEDYTATIKASRLSDEEEEGEPLELDEPGQEDLDDGDTGQLVSDEDEEENLPPTVRITKGKDEEDENLEGPDAEDDDFAPPEEPEEDDKFKDGDL